MGVNGLWKLLAPVGRRVSIETLERKTLAVDVSIWLVKFIKTMRDEEGKVAKNAHIIGTLRRVIKLLFHRIRPIFVFDGGAPALKEQTLKARRRLRTNAEVNVTKTAQRILTVQLKKAAKARAAAQAQAKADAARHKAEGTSAEPAVPGMAPGFNPGGEHDTSAAAGGGGGGSDASSDVNSSVQGSSSSRPRANPHAVLLPVEDSEDEEAGLVWEAGEPSDSDEREELTGFKPRRPAAAPSADAPAIGSGSESDSDEDGGWEHAVVLPTDEQEIDLDVLASLPAAMRKNVIETAKRQQRLRSRKQYMPVAASPHLYSQTQIANFLRTSDLNRKINEVQSQRESNTVGKSIASDASRKYVLVRGDSTRSADSRASAEDDRHTVAVDSSTPFDSMSSTRNGALQHLQGSSISRAEAKRQQRQQQQRRRQRLPSDSSSASDGETAGSRPAVTELSQSSEDEGVEESKGGETEPRHNSSAYNSNNNSSSAQQQQCCQQEQTLSAAASDAIGADEGGFLLDDIGTAGNTVSAGLSASAGDVAAAAVPSAAEDLEGGFLLHDDSPAVPAAVSAVTVPVAARLSSNDRTAAVNTVSTNGANAHDSSLMKAVNASAASNGTAAGDASTGVAAAAATAAAAASPPAGAVVGAAAAAPAPTVKPKGKGKGKAKAKPAATAAATAAPAAAVPSRHSDFDYDYDYDGETAGAVPNSITNGDSPVRLSRAEQEKQDELLAQALFRADEEEASALAAAAAAAADAASPVETSGLGALAAVAQAAKTEMDLDNKREEDDLELALRLSLAHAEAGSTHGDERIGGGASTVKEQPSPGPLSSLAAAAAALVDANTGGSSSGGSGGSNAAQKALLAHTKCEPSTAAGSSSSTAVNAPLAERFIAKAEAASAQAPAKAATVPVPAINGTDSCAAAAAAGAAPAHIRDVQLDLSDVADVAEPVTAKASPVLAATSSNPTEATAPQQHEIRDVELDLSDVAGLDPDIASAVFGLDLPGASSAGTTATAAAAAGEASSDDEYDGHWEAGDASAAGAATDDSGSRLWRADSGGAYSNSSSTAQLQHQGAAAIAANKAALDSAMATASKMANWAGRAVAKALREHAGLDGLQLQRSNSSGAAAAGVGGSSYRRGSAGAYSNSSQGVRSPGSELGIEEIMRGGRAGSSASARLADVEADADTAEDAMLVEEQQQQPQQQQQQQQQQNPTVVYLDDEDKESAAGSAHAHSAAPAAGSAAAASMTAQQRQRAAANRAWAPMPPPAGRAASAGSSVSNAATTAAGGGGSSSSVWTWAGGSATEGAEDVREESSARTAHKKAQRDADTVTEEMLEEVKELLHMFGVPYIVAPMEAEAQCVELEKLGLVEGVVTDDSDAFVFGAKAVYKNIFEEQKFVEAYLLPDVKHELGISTPEMRAMALLLGSDYTTGIKNVGIVNATEIMHAFPLAPEETSPGNALRRFRTWLDGFDPIGDAELEKRIKSSIKKGEAAAEAEGVTPEQRFHLRHKAARNRWVAAPSFPSEEVLKAYEKPQVNSATDAFEWQLPDVAAIQRLCSDVLGWPPHKTDALVLPMMAKLEQRSLQPRLDSYFTAYHSNARFAKIKSKRLREAVGELSGIEPEAPPPLPQIRRASSAGTSVGSDDDADAAADASINTADNNSSSSSKRGRGRGTRGGKRAAAAAGSTASSDSAAAKPAAKKRKKATASATAAATVVAAGSSSKRKKGRKSKAAAAWSSDSSSSASSDASSSEKHARKKQQTGDSTSNTIEIGDTPVPRQQPHRASRASSASYVDMCADVEASTDDADSGSGGSDADADAGSSSAKK